MENLEAFQYCSSALEKIIISPKELQQIISEKYTDKKVVLVKGVYDIFHSGHYLSFLNAKKLGDILIVAVNSDAAVRLRKGPNRPIIDQGKRMLLIAALECVDWVTLYDEESPFNLITTIKPYIFGASHFDSLTTVEIEEIQKNTILSSIPKLGSDSTTKIINKIKNLDK